MAELDASPQTGKSLHFDNIDENDVSVDIPSFQFIKHLHDLSRQAQLIDEFALNSDEINQFEDSLFHANRLSLINPDDEEENLDKNYFAVEDIDEDWVRPRQVLPPNVNPVLFATDSTPGEIFTRDLDNMNFLGSLAAVSTHPHLISNLFGKVDAIDSGLLSCFFFKEGDWREVIIDTRLPYCRDQRDGDPHFPCANSSERTEFWVAFLEKAYAKLLGSYYATAKVSIADALVDLTGGCVEKINLTLPEAQMKKESEEMWLAVQTWFAAGCVIVCVSESDSNATVGGLSMAQSHSIAQTLNHNDDQMNNPNFIGGIPPEISGDGIEYKNGVPLDLALSILDVVEYQDLKLVRIRCPWPTSAEQTWQGAFKDYDQEWNNYPALKEHLGYQFNHDGTWWMRFTDFASHFNRLYVTRLFPRNYCQVQAKGSWKSELASGPPRSLLPFICGPGGFSNGNNGNNLSTGVTTVMGTTLLHGRGGTTLGGTSIAGPATLKGTTVVGGYIDNATIVNGGTNFNTQPTILGADSTVGRMSMAATTVLGGNDAGTVIGGQTQNSTQQVVGESAGSTPSVVQDPDCGWFNNPHYKLSISHHNGKSATVFLSLLQSDAFSYCRINFAVLKRPKSGPALAAENAFVKVSGSNANASNANKQKILSGLTGVPGAPSSSVGRVWSFNESDVLGLAVPVDFPPRANSADAGPREVVLELEIDCQDPSTNTSKVIIVPFEEVRKLNQGHASSGTTAAGAKGSGIHSALDFDPGERPFILRAFSANKLTMLEVPFAHCKTFTHKWHSGNAGGRRRISKSANGNPHLTSANVQWASNPQFLVSVSKPTEVRVVLERHRTKSKRDRVSMAVPCGLTACRLLSAAQTISDSPFGSNMGAADRGRPHVIAVKGLTDGSLLKESGKEDLAPIRRKLLIERDEWCTESSYNSPEIACLHLSLTPEHGRVVIIPSLANPGTTSAFTLRIYSDEPLRTIDQLDEYAHQVICSAWTPANAGGCHLHDTAFDQREDSWRKNPAFLLKFPQRQLDCKITLARLSSAWNASVAKNSVGCMMGLYVLNASGIGANSNIILNNNTSITGGTSTISPSRISGHDNQNNNNTEGSDTHTVGGNSTSNAFQVGRVAPTSQSPKIDIKYAIEDYETTFLPGAQQTISLSLPPGRSPVVLLASTLEPKICGEFIIYVAAPEGGFQLTPINENEF